MAEKTPDPREKRRLELQAEERRAKDRAEAMIKGWRDREAEQERLKNPGTRGDVIRAFRKARSGILTALALGVGTYMVQDDVRTIRDFYSPQNGDQVEKTIQAIKVIVKPYRKDPFPTKIVKT